MNDEQRTMYDGNDNHTTGVILSLVATQTSGGGWTSKQTKKKRAHYQIDKVFLFACDKAGICCKRTFMN